MSMIGMDQSAPLLVGGLLAVSEALEGFPTEGSQWTAIVMALWLVAFCLKWLREEKGASGVGNREIHYRVTEDVLESCDRLEREHLRSDSAFATKPVLDAMQKQEMHAARRHQETLLALGGIKGAIEKAG